MVNNVVKKIIERINAIDENASKEEKKMSLDILIKEVYGDIKNLSMEYLIAILDKIYNLSPVIFYSFLELEDERIYRASLCLEKLKNMDLVQIKEDLKEAIKLNNSMIVFNGTSSVEIVSSRIRYNDLIYKKYNSYLKKRSLEEINDNLKKDLNYFASHLSNIADDIFSEDMDYFPRRNFIVDNLFLCQLVDIDILNKVYDEVLMHNKMFRKYDFERIITSNDLSLLLSIKGLYRKFPAYLFDDLSMIDELPLDNYFLELEEFFLKIIELNKDDEVGLRWFFGEIRKRTINNERFNQYFKNKDFYQKYTKDYYSSFEITLKKLLNEETDIDESILLSIGEDSEFIKCFDVLLDKFIKSKNNDYKRILLFPLAFALAEKQKGRYNVDFKIILSSKNTSDYTLGSYNEKDKVLYINPNFVDKYNGDLDKALVSVFNTVFHETRHASQYQTLKTSMDLSYENFVMAADLILSGSIADSDYYRDNYEHISFERDARNIAHVDVLTLFEKYPEMQQKEVTYYDRDYHLSNFIRKGKLDKYERYYGIIDNIIQYIQTNLKIAKESPDLYNIVFEKLNKYPVINVFLEIDYEHCTVKLRSNEYFEKKIKELEKTNNDLLIEEARNSLKELQFGVKVSKYLKSKSHFLVGKEGDYLEEIIKEIDENVGKSNAK